MADEFSSNGQLNQRNLFLLWHRHDARILLCLFGTTAINRAQEGNPKFAGLSAR